MQLLFHQLRTDFRHFRFELAALWVLFAIHACLVPQLPASAMRYSPRGVTAALMVLAAAFVVVRCVQADSFSNSNAWWMTRPLSRSQLFVSKTGLLLLFVVGPWLVAQGVIWWELQFTLAQCLQAAVEVTLTALVLVFFCATLAAHTRHLAAFSVAVLVAAAGFYVGLIFWYLVHVERLAPVFHTISDRHWLSLNASANAVGLGFLLLCCGGAWVANTWPACRRLSLGLIGAGLLLVMPLTVSWPYDFLRAQPKPVAGLALELVDEEAADVSPPMGQQMLWSHFRVTGLKARQWAAVEDLDATFRATNELNQPAADVSVRSSQQMWRNYDALGSIERHSPQAADCYRIIKGDYPSGTLWLGTWAGRPDRLTLPVGNQFPSEWRSHPPQGVFFGKIGLRLFEVVRVGGLPLRAQSVATVPGERLTLEKIEPVEGGLRLRLRLREASLRLSQEERSSRGTGLQGCGGYLFVLYQSRFGEAYPLQVQRMLTARPGLAGIEQTVWADAVLPFPALRARLTGISLEEWLREARLDAYALIPAGGLTEIFKQGNYTLRLSQANPAKTSSAWEEASTQVGSRLSDPERRARLDVLLDGLAENWGMSEAQRIQSQLLSLGPKVVPLLLERVPCTQRLESLVMEPVLSRLATREFLPDLRAALAKDLALARVFRRKGWEKDARDVVLAKLAERRQPLPLDAFLLVAAAKDPSTYADLAWHFAHLRYGHEALIPALRACPGFDLPGAIRTAWQRARFGFVSPRELALSAARQGLPEALDRLILQLEEERDETRQQEALKTLASLVNYDGPSQGFARWLSDHLGQFRYDPGTHRYRLTQ